MKGPHGEEWDQPLGAESDPPLTASEETGASVHSLKELDSANDLNELESAFFPGGSYRESSLAGTSVLTLRDPKQRTKPRPAGTSAPQNCELINKWMF